MTTSHSNAIWWVQMILPAHRWVKVTDRQIKILLEIQDKIPEITIRGNEIWKTKNLSHEN